MGDLFEYFCRDFEVVEIFAVGLVGQDTGSKDQVLAAVLLMEFGTCRIGEGLGYDWPLGDPSILWPPMALCLLTTVGALILRRSEV